MKFLLALLTILIIALMFSLPSLSQSYASARQAQATIEASRAAQIASTGNLVVIATLAILLLAAIAIISYLLLHASQLGQVRNSRPHTGLISDTDMNSILPAMLTMLLYQMMQNDQSRHEQNLLFCSRYEEDLALLEDEDIPWTI